MLSQAAHSKRMCYGVLMCKKDTLRNPDSFWMRRAELFRLDDIAVGIIATCTSTLNVHCAYLSCIINHRCAGLGDDFSLHTHIMLRKAIRPRLTLALARRRQFCSSSRLAADHVRIVEVGPRDGLQNEKSTISLETKIELIERLAKTGVTHMEAGSFVAPKWVPQVS